MLINEIIGSVQTLGEAGGEFNPDKILSHIEDIEEDGMTLVIPVNKPLNDGIFINSVSMYMGTDIDDDMGGGDSDLGVNYSITSDDLDPDEVMGEFYGDDLYTEELIQVLMQAGFSKEAASNTGPSESGMQDYDRASYDTAIGNDVRKALADVTSKTGNKIGAMVLRTRGIKNLATAEEYKEGFIKWALGRVKEHGIVPLQVKLALEALQSMGAKWPEIAVIMRSAKVIG